MAYTRKLTVLAVAGSIFVYSCVAETEKGPY